MMSRRPTHRLDWSILWVMAFLIGSYVITWLVFRPKLPINWKSSPYHSLFKRQALDQKYNWTPSQSASSDILTGTATAPTNADSYDPCICQPCRFPPFNCDTQRPLGTVPDHLQPIPCLTDTSSDRIDCLRNITDDQVYLPVSFVNELFEVSGYIRKDNKGDVYEFRYSYATLFEPQASYHPSGIFLNFDHIHVERRSKVVCVTASEGVPLTNQWRPEGYYYAITVAQYGLSHHAKGLLKGNPVPRVIASGEMDIAKWDTAKQNCSMAQVQLSVRGLKTKVLSFTSSDTLNSSGPILEIQSNDQSLGLDIMLIGSGGVTVKIKTKDNKLGYLHYDHGSNCLRIDKEYHVHYGMNTTGKPARWIHLVRDIATDWWKGYPMSPFDSLVSLTLHGQGYLDNVTLAPAAHVEHLIQAADWLMNHQDGLGGWPTHVSIQTGPISLKSGWYSAMGQGQAMSTLVRAFNVTGLNVYLKSAVKATNLFKVPSSKGGIVSKFMNQFDWYEEYPTTPHGTFVLNGFMFSLLGLYDVMETTTGEGHAQTKMLWTSGVNSLKNMLGMFDSGTGTFYDLRHVIHHEQPNRARWDYHAVHVALLQQMTIIDNDPIYASTLDRWRNYFHGKRSKHN